jgi:hypothetical protein
VKSLEEMQAEVKEVNLAHGWFDEPVPFAQACMLMVSEIAEAYEAYRGHGLEDFTAHQCADAPYLPPGKPAKPEGVGSEFADTFIRLLDNCEKFGIDLRAEYERKVAYNRTRPYRHGGKRE